MVRTILVDFDGVLHSYASGWQGEAIIPDDPVPGAIEWLNSLLNDHPDFQICIYSSRSKSVEGILAMKMWFKKFGIKNIENLKFPTEKPAAWLTIDDRCVCFVGKFPTYEEMRDFKPWYQKM